MASYAAAIKDSVGVEPVVETGSKGQFDVLVDGKLVVSRKGGLWALVTKKPWPTNEEVIRAVTAEFGGHNEDA